MYKDQSTSFYINYRVRLYNKVMIFCGVFWKKIK